MTRLRVNWYKPGGKWYTGCDISVPDDFDPQPSHGFRFDALFELIIRQQTQLSPAWHRGEWYVAVTCIEQAGEDHRFFERLYRLY